MENKNFVAVTLFLALGICPLFAGGPFFWSAGQRSDVANRTETAMSQAHAFLAMELALNAQAEAYRLERQD